MREAPAHSRDLQRDPRDCAQHLPIRDASGEQACGCRRKFSEDPAGLARPLTLSPAAPQSGCSPPWQAPLRARLLSHAEAANLEADPAWGCAPARRLQASRAAYDALLAFRGDCAGLLSGAAPCAADGDCYTACAGGACAAPPPWEFGAGLRRLCQ
jgi:hypothetical protein